MLGAGSSGAWQLFGRTSVVPGGHASPGWIVVRGAPRPPGGCAAAVPASTRAVNRLPAADTRRIDAPEGGRDNLSPVRGGGNPGRPPLGDEPGRLLHQVVPLRD